MHSYLHKSVRTSLALGAVVLVTTVASAFAYLADPAAVLVGVTGSVQVQRSGKPSASPATVGLQLEIGDKVIVPAGGKAVLLYKTGKMEPATATVTIADAKSTGPGTLYSQTVKQLGQIATTNAKLQANRQGMIRPVQGEPVPVAPRNNVKVLDLRPTFTWFKVADAAGYMVQVRRLSPAGGRPERFQVSRDTSWSYPSTAAPLIPGGEYEWTVGVQGGRIAGAQKFRVVSGEEFVLVANALRELATAGIDPLTDGLFVTALAYREAGLFYEANQALVRLAASGGKGRAFHMMRGEMLDALGYLDAATKAFAAADAEPASE